jgi:hypothetical protein
MSTTRITELFGECVEIKCEVLEKTDKATQIGTYNLRSSSTEFVV